MLLGHSLFKIWIVLVGGGRYNVLGAKVLGQDFVIVGGSRGLLDLTSSKITLTPAGCALTAQGLCLNAIHNDRFAILSLLYRIVAPGCLW